jgi:uncharacterized membrane protein YgdD (TMEM256/DUF423 family)
MERTFFLMGSALGALSVALGAFGAHALRGKLPDNLLANFQTGVTYQFYHALALFVVVYALGRWPSAAGTLSWAGWLMVIGVFFFSGSLYLMAATGQRWLGAVTPIGGVAFIAGWLLLFVSAWRNS